MTIKRNFQADHRTRPISEPVYKVPVVRELPAQPPDPVGAQALW
jgi:hypothetical protein